MHCLNCLAPNAPGAINCHRCHMPGDFGQAPTVEARIVESQLVDCNNCGGHAPAQAAHCPTCRWPLPAAAPNAWRAEAHPHIPSPQVQSAAA